MKDVLSNYLETDYPGYHDTPTINEFKYFCNPDTTYGRLANINNDLEFLEEAEVMTSTERQHIEDIVDVIFQVKNNTATTEDYYQLLLEKRDEIAEENFEFVSRVVDIGISSYEYWTDYWDNVEPPVSGVANWVAQDAAGVIVGGTIAAVTEYASTGDVSLGG